MSPTIFSDTIYPPEHAASLELMGLTHRYHKGGRDIFKDVSLTISPGELVCILGPNGAGKSTLMNCMAGLIRPVAGKVLLDGEEIFSLSAKRVARRIAYVPQMASSTYDYTVFEYLLLGRASHLGLIERPSKRDYQIVESVLELTQLDPYAAISIRALSGGELQMVSIARLLVQHAGLIMFDEPTSALDAANQMRVMSIIETLNKAGFGVVMTTHSPEQALMLGGSVIMVGADGRCEHGSVEKLVTEERLSELYQTSIIIENIERAGRRVSIAQRLDQEFSGFQTTRG